MTIKKVKDHVLVVAAHPDDEVLGCGGVMARHSAEGDAVYTVFLADGVSSRNSKKGLSEREGAARKAAAILGSKTPLFLNFPDNRLDTIPLLDVVQAVESVIARIKPHIIYTHHGGDLNIDHVITQRAVMTACRPLAGSPVRAIYGFEVLSSTEWSIQDGVHAFLPSRFVNIECFMAQKLQAMQAYKMEIRPFPHPRSKKAIQALATFRGVQSGLNEAEAFTTLRIREE